MAQVRPIPTSYYYSGQGRLGIGDRNPTTGEFSNVKFVGNVTSLSLDIAVTKFEHKESMSGGRAVDKTIIQERNGTFKFVSESLNLELLAVGLYGTASTLTSGTVTNEAHNDVKRGYALPLKYPNVSSIVVNKAGTPVTAAGNWDHDAKFGTIYILANASGIADGDDLTVNYSYGAADKLEAFTTGTPPEKYLRFEGLNTVDGSYRLIEIPRAAFDPLTGMELINEEFGSGEFNGQLLPDLTVVTEGISQYFREHRMAA